MMLARLGEDGDHLHVGGENLAVAVDDVGTGCGNPGRSGTAHLARVLARARRDRRAARRSRPNRPTKQAAARPTRDVLLSRRGETARGRASTPRFGEPRCPAIRFAASWRHEAHRRSELGRSRCGRSELCLSVAVGVGKAERSSLRPISSTRGPVRQIGQARELLDLQGLEIRWCLSTASWAIGTVETLPLGLQHARWPRARAAPAISASPPARRNRASHT